MDGSICTSHVLDQLWVWAGVGFIEFKVEAYSAGSFVQSAALCSEKVRVMS